MLRYRLLSLVMPAVVLASGCTTPAPMPSGSGALSSQAVAVEDPNLRDFDFVVEKVRLNYAGWDTKVTEETRPALDALTERLRREAAGAADDELAALLREWTGFFEDGHIGIVSAASSGAGAADSVDPARTPKLDWNEERAQARLASLGEARDALEGIWRIDGDRYRVAVLRDPGGPEQFSAVVLSTTSESWSPGQVKAELTREPGGEVRILFRAGDHSEHRTSARLRLAGAAISVEGWGHWIREVPAITDPDLVDRAIPASRLFLKSLSDQTIWLRVPDFGDSRAAPLEALLAANEAALGSAPNLIIDLRANGGGSDFVYDPLIPLLYTRPIYSIGVEMRASEDNIALRSRIADDLRGEVPDIAARLDAQNARMAAGLGAFVPGSDEVFTVRRLEAVRAFPKRIAVLIDEAASSGEQFLLEARQSRKVTLFGQANSAGVLDFANVVGMPAPSGRFDVYWATSRSMRLPFDPVDPDGIAPDIRIPETETDPVTFARQWLERQAD